jgi:ERCC4-related helicase
MLIRWIAAQVHTPRKFVVFLANTVSLVHQQAAFIKEQTELDVRAYSGMGNDASGNRIDSWDAVRWSIEFQEADVFVLTRKMFSVYDPRTRYTPIQPRSF